MGKLAAAAMHVGKKRRVAADRIAGLLLSHPGDESLYEALTSNQEQFVDVGLLCISSKHSRYLEKISTSPSFSTEIATTLARAITVQEACFRSLMLLVLREYLTYHSLTLDGCFEIDTLLRQIPLCGDETTHDRCIFDVLNLLEENFEYYATAVA
jgi:hypothetical protein